MLQTRIVVDEHKILHETDFDLNDVWNIIDTTFVRRGLSVAGKGVYRDTGSERDYGRIWAAIYDLMDTKWFMETVAEWYWLNSEESDREEDLLAAARR